MAEAPLTLKSIFSDDPAAPIAPGAQMGACIKAVGVACEGLPKGAVPGLNGAVEAAMDDMLSIDLGGILQRSWKKLKALDAAIQATAKDPAAVSFVPLLDHKVTAKHQPYVDLTYGTAVLGRLQFEISLNLQLRGVVLEIRQGRVAGVRSGHCQGEGVFSFGGEPILKHASKELKLGGRLMFGPEPLSSPPAEPTPSFAPVA